jgi:hypothetical protein
MPTFRVKVENSGRTKIGEIGDGGESRGDTHDYNQVSRENRQFAASLLREARHLHSSHREQVAYFKNEIREQEKVNERNIEEQRKALEERRNKAKELAPGQDRQKEFKEINKSEDEIRLKEKESSQQIKELRKIHSVLHTSYVEDEKRHNENKQLRQQDKSQEEASSKRRFFGLLPPKKHKDEERREGEKETFWEGVKKNFVGHLLADSVQKGWGQLMALPTVKDEEQAIAKVWNIIPFVGEFLASAAERSVEEREETEKAHNRMRGVVGNKYGWLSEAGLGMDFSETMDVAGKFARIRGFASDLPLFTRDIIGLQKAYGLEDGQVGGFARMERYEAGGRGTLRMIESTVETLKRKGAFEGGDMSHLSEILEDQLKLAEEQSKSLEKIDINTNAQVMASFSSIGGSFYNDPRAGARILQLNKALAEPANEYQRAMNYAILGQMKPGASFLEVLEMQEKGISEKGFMKETMKAIEAQYGGGEAAILATKIRFGISAEQAKTLWHGYERDRGAFDLIGTEGLISSEAEQRKKVMGLAYSHVSGREVSQAVISDAFAQDMWTGIATVMERTGEALIEKLDDLGGIMRDLFTGGDPKEKVKTIKNKPRK